MLTTSPQSKATLYPGSLCGLPFSIQRPRSDSTVAWRPGHRHPLRLRFGRDDRVRVNQGPYEGRRATVESRHARWVENGVIHQEPGYSMVLDDCAGRSRRRRVQQWGRRNACQSSRDFSTWADNGPNAGHKRAVARTPQTAEWKMIYIQIPKPKPGSKPSPRQVRLSEAPKARDADDRLV